MNGLSYSFIVYFLKITCCLAFYNFCSRLLHVQKLGTVQKYEINRLEGEFGIMLFLFCFVLFCFHCEGRQKIDNMFIIVMDYQLAFLNKN